MLISLDELTNLLIVSLVQGLTEFLPISSSGHIEVVKILLNINVDNLILLTHVGSGLAIALYYRNSKQRIDNIRLMISRKLIAKFALSQVCSLAIAVPVYLVYAYLESKADADQLLLYLGAAIIINASILQNSDTPNEPKIISIDRLGWIQMTGLGLAQGISAIPGISRMAMFFLAGRCLGLNKALVLDLSIVFYIPLVLIFIGLSVGTLTQIVPSIVVIILSLLASLGVLELLSHHIRRIKLVWFAPWCLILGLYIVLFA